jgi:hypothetical protein
MSRSGEKNVSAVTAPKPAPPTRPRSGYLCLSDATLGRSGYRGTLPGRD